VEHGRDWAVAVLSASAGRNDERRLRETVERTCREAAAGFSADELRRARKKIRYRFARLADSRLDRALAHASRVACGQPSPPPRPLRPALPGAAGAADGEPAPRRGRGSVAPRAGGAHADGGAARLMRRSGALVVVLALALGAHADEAPAPLGACGPITRRHDA